VETLPQDYVIQTLYTRCKRPVYKKHQRVYNAECCVCHEGHSAGRKRRLFYFLEDRYFYCFNCGRSWKEMPWIQEVTHQSYPEILKEASHFTCSVDLNVKLETPENKTISISPIPEDSIDICNETECNFYGREKETKLIRLAQNYCKERKILEAINRPKSLYVSCEDYIHKNRLIIPFYSEIGKIECYQSRSLDKSNEYPKYLTKYGEKCLFGENHLDSSIPYIFILEGPIDAMFIKNSLAIGGSTITERQETFLKKCLGYEIIYVYDNDTNNQQMDRKIHQLIKQNKKLFIWPREMKKYKDINEVCCSLNLNEFPYKFIVENSFSGIEALLKSKK